MLVAPPLEQHLPALHFNFLDHAVEVRVVSAAAQRGEVGIGLAVAGEDGCALRA